MFMILLICGHSCRACEDQVGKYILKLFFSWRNADEAMEKL
jgi:hypothetical protein